MATGFDKTTVDALVLYGYPLEGLTYAQCERVERAIARLGPGLAAAPHGDLSASGSSSASTSEQKCSVTFVVGTVVGRARTAAVEDATTQSASVNTAICARARAAFDAARPHVDAALAAEMVAPSDEPGLFVLAAGPRASARLDGDPGAILQEIPPTGPASDPVQRFLVTSKGGGPAPRVRLEGQFTLSAQYD